MSHDLLSGYWASKWEGGIECDVKIVCTSTDGEDTALSCHSFVLVPASPEFEHLNQVAKSSTPNIDQQDNFKLTIEHSAMTYDSWTVFLCFVYYGKDFVKKLEALGYSNSDIVTQVQSVIASMQLSDIVFTSINNWLQAATVEQNKIEVKMESVDDFEPGSICCKNGTELKHLDLVCLSCWSKDTVCVDAKFLRCLLCAESVSVTSLPEHYARNHSTEPTVFLSCDNKSDQETLSTSRKSALIGCTLHELQNGIETEFFQCLACDFKAATLPVFRTHLTNEHGVKEFSNNDTLCCSVCSAFFTTFSAKEEHEFFCSGKTFPFCEKCGERFSLPSKLRRHEKNCRLKTIPVATGSRKRRKKDAIVSEVTVTCLQFF